MSTRTNFFAEAAALNSAGADAVTPDSMAEVLVRNCALLEDEVLRRLPALPDVAADVLREEPFADRAPGILLAAEWLESFCAALDLPLAEVDGGWTVSDEEANYFCPVVSLADDPDSPQDTRLFARLDGIRVWTEEPAELAQVDPGARAQEAQPAPAAPPVELPPTSPPADVAPPAPPADVTPAPPPAEPPIGRG
jgi:hypothetical protein